jgi:DNA-binding transcriptional LysR family regulator
VLAESGLVLRPRIESDSVASIYALVDSGSWAGVVPREWIHASSFSPDIRVVTIGEPPITSAVSLVTAASEPGSLLARALVDTARELELDELFERAAAR